MKKIKFILSLLFKKEFVVIYPTRRYESYYRERITLYRAEPFGMTQEDMDEALSALEWVDLDKQYTMNER